VEEQSMEDLIAWGIGSLTTAICGGVGLYLGAYLRKKGENLATHEDIDGLVEQVRAVTRVTKEIEANVSGEVFNRERLWLRRSILLDGAKKLGALVETFFALGTAYKVDAKQIRSGLPGNTEELGRRGDKFHEASKVFLGSTFFMLGLVSGKEMGQLLWALFDIMNKIEHELADGKPDAVEGRASEFGEALKCVIDTFQRELGLGVQAQ
jgi:hypothetical protein